MRQGPTPALARIRLAFVALGLLVAPGLALAGPWSLPDEARGSRVAPLLLLSRADVRADLGCPTELAGQVDQAIERLRRKAAATHGRTGPEAVEGRKAVDEEEKNWLETHLTDEQIERLGQLDLRWEGFGAIVTRPTTVGASLGLADEQKAALAKIVSDRDAARRANPRDLAAQAKSEEKALALLTEGQREQWARMLGKPFAFTPRPADPSAKQVVPGR